MLLFWDVLLLFHTFFRLYNAGQMFFGGASSKKNHSWRLKREFYGTQCQQAMFSSIQKHFLRCKMLVGECPKPLCSAFSNAGCASLRDAFYPVMLSGSLRTCMRCDAASAREAYFICSGTGASRNEMPHSCIQKKLIWTSYAGCSIEKWLIERIDDKCESKYDQYTQLFSRLAKDIDALAKAW